MKKKSEEGRKRADAHASTFVVRLPEVFRGQLAKLRLTTRRPITVEVQLALEEHLRKHGLWPAEGAAGGKSPDGAG
jgi:hypothetical protein